MNNHYRGQPITLELSDQWKPRLTAQDGSAGSGEEVYADFDWTGQQEGDVCFPYATVAAAQAAVASTPRALPRSGSQNYLS